MSIKIEHLAIWTKDLEKSKDFYIKYFEMEGDQAEKKTVVYTFRRK
ncbi:MAG TPA: hypothetical protein PKD51_09075 [Saprospiraceae bacterium]|nr:hypothetical protein [Saprospiraceae bacterium]HMU02320.1 hypothetical protein [Saprospiraceae bacterium]